MLAARPLGDGQVGDRPLVPRQLPACQGEQPVHQRRGEPPDQHAPDPERGRDQPARPAHHQPRGGIGQLADADPLDRGHLARIHGRDRARPPPPGDYRDDPEPGPRDKQLRQGGDHLDAARVEAHLLGCLPQRRRDRAGIACLDRPAGEGGLAGMQPQSPAALDEQQVRAARALAEQHQHGRRGAAFGRRGGPGDPRLAGGGRQLAQPRRRSVSPAGPIPRRPSLPTEGSPVPWCRPGRPRTGGPPAPRCSPGRHENGPGLTSLAAVSGSVGPSP